MALLQNTPQGGTPQNKIEAKDTILALKEALKIQGDYNNLLKDSVRELEKSIKSYDKLGAKLSSINKTTINIKDVEKQIKENQINRFTTTQKLADLQEKLSDSQKRESDRYLGAINARSKKEKELIEAQKNGNAVQVTLLSSAIQSIERQIELKSATLNIDQLSYAQAKKSDQLYEETEGRLKEQLVTEKKIGDSIGFTGKTFKLFADKLGLGADYYEDMVVKARQLELQNKKLSFGDKLGGLAKAAGGGIKEAFSDPLTLIPILGGAIGGIVSGLKSVFDYITGIQDKTVKFARAMNMSTEEARQLKMEFASVNVANGDLLVNTQKLVEAQMDMVSALGVTNRISTENLATNIKLKDIAGVEADTIASITESSIINGKSNESIVKSVFAQVKGLKQATGIQFENRKILKEASSLGGVLGLQFAKYPAQLSKSLVTVKAMGLELKQVDAIADSFLDFESSISKEFEAQLLTGKEINLAKARELFLDNDLAGAAAEINKQVGSTADFLKMNRIQQDAFAGAMGMSRDQMGDMLKKQEMLSILGAKDTDNAREQLKLGLAKYKNQKALSEAMGEENYQNLVNASLQEKIAGFIEKIKQSISDFVEKSGIIGKIEGLMEKLSDPENIRKVIMGVRDFFAGAVEFIGKAAYYILEGLDYVAFGQIPDAFIDSIKSGAENMGAQIRSMGGDLSMTAATEKAGIGGGGGGTTQTAPSTKMGRPSGGTTTINFNANGKTLQTVVVDSVSQTPQEETSTGKIPTK
jgi:hypothetical protein